MYFVYHYWCWVSALLLQSQGVLCNDVVQVRLDHPFDWVIASEQLLSHATLLEALAQKARPALERRLRHLETSERAKLIFTHHCHQPTFLGRWARDALGDALVIDAQNTTSVWLARIARCPNLETFRACVSKK
jgi:hypothetical protein